MTVDGRLLATLIVAGVVLFVLWQLFVVVATKVEELHEYRYRWAPQIPCVFGPRGHAWEPTQQPLSHFRSRCPQCGRRGYRDAAEMPRRRFV